MVTVNGSNVEMTSVKPLEESYDNPTFISDTQDEVRVVVVPNENSGNALQDYTDGNQPPTTFKDDSGLCNQFGECNSQVKSYFVKHKHFIKKCVLFSLLILYNIYLGFAIHISWDKAESWCSGVRFITLITAIVYCSVIGSYVLKKLFGRALYRNFVIPFTRISDRFCGKRWSGLVAFVGVLGAIFIFILVDAGEDIERLISFSGLCTLLFLGFIFSKHPGKIIFRHLAWGIGLQFIFALITLRWDIGKNIFECLGDKVEGFLSYSVRGAEFVFSYLASGKFAPGNATMDALVIGNTSYNATAVNLVIPSQFAIFVAQVLPVVLFFSFFVSILYYWGVMQWIIIKTGWLLQVTIGTTAAESMNAAANIFVGQTEAPLIIKPYLSIMTKSELHAVMTGGFATIAGAVMAAYIALGISASHLLSASVMSAPAALAFSKLVYPETEVSRTMMSALKIEKPKEQNVLEAATSGVTMAITLCACIAANLIAFVAFIYFVDELLMFFGSLVGWNFLSMTYIISQVFSPLAYLMGVPWAECETIGRLIGMKTILNEFIAYKELAVLRDTLSKRSQIVATYALCGFSNFASIGIQLGGLGAMAPERLSDLSGLALRAMLAGSGACFLTACLAGALIQ